MLTNLRLPLWLATAAFCSWQILRFALWWRFSPLDTSLGDTLKLLLAGIHIDAAWALIGSGILIGFSALLTTLIAVVPVLVLRLFQIHAWGPVWRVLFRIAITVGCTAGVFLIISEWFFFAEFDSRFNTVAIDYLVYPHEVFTNLRESYPLPLIGAVCLLGGVSISWLGFAKFRPVWQNHAFSAKLKFLGLAALVCLLAHQSILNVETSFSRQRVVNQLANNGWASAAEAAWTRNLEYKAFYLTLNRREAFLRARQLLAEPGATFIAPEPPPLPPEPLTAEADEGWIKAARDSITRDVAGDATRKKLNVCIIAEESLGSEFWGCLGREGPSLTPRMDALAAKEGLLFTRMLADGNRTIRGMEAIYSSIPPLPGDSILARDKTENVETIARVLKRDGYSTQFLYAGHGTFDFIKSYALHNGWDSIVEETDFENPAFRTAWGVSDEDLLQRGIIEMRRLHETGKPFLSSFLTVTNHRPFTYPAGRIPEDPDAHNREHAVKYADWALGDFFDRARKEAFWNDTIFVVIADHGARVYGRQTIPLKSYQIPCLIVAPSLSKTPQRNDTQGCQLDLIPTVLGMIGRPYRSLFFGHDLLKGGAADRDRSLMHHNRSIAVYHDKMQTVFGLNKTVEYWYGDAASVFMKRVSESDAAFDAIRDDGTALFEVADDLYMHRQFQLAN